MASDPTGHDDMSYDDTTDTVAPSSLSSSPPSTLDGDLSRRTSTQSSHFNMGLVPRSAEWTVIL
jgi:hypothetical protein